MSILAKIKSFFAGYAKDLKEVQETARQQSPKHKAWLEDRNGYYDLGDAMAAAVRAGISVVGKGVLGEEVSEAHSDCQTAYITKLTVDDRLSLKIVRQWNDVLATELGRRGRNKKVLFWENLNALTFYIDGLPVDYSYDIYHTLGMKAALAIDEKVKAIQEKKANLVEDYLKGNKEK